MRDWPPITEPELLERLAMDDGAFLALMREVLSAMPARDFEPEIFERGLGYPFERPVGSYIWRDGDVELLTTSGPQNERTPSMPSPKSATPSSPLVPTPRPPD